MPALASVTEGLSLRGGRSPTWQSVFSPVPGSRNTDRHTSLRTGSLCALRASSFHSSLFTFHASFSPVPVGATLAVARGQRSVSDKRAVEGASPYGCGRTFSRRGDSRIAREPGAQNGQTGRRGAHGRAPTESWASTPFSQTDAPGTCPGRCRFYKGRADGSGNRIAVEVE